MHVKHHGFIIMFDKDRPFEILVSKNGEIRTMRNPSPGTNIYGNRGLLARITSIIQSDWENLKLVCCLLDVLDKDGKVVGHSTYVVTQ